MTLMNARRPYFFFLNPLKTNPNDSALFRTNKPVIKHSIRIMV